MSPPLPASICVGDLTKRYGPVTAVAGVSLTVAPGEIFGLLGLNGAGKTTTLECLLGLRSPDTGTIRIAGVDVRAAPRAARRQVGAQLQSAALPDKITPREALALFGSFYPGAAAPTAMLEHFNLTAKADAPFDTLSGGQRQRLFLALALVHAPSVVVLDEPTAGLDPRARHDLHGLIRELRIRGCAVLLSTHYLEEAHGLCDRIGILHESRLIATSTPAALVAGARAVPRLTFRSSRPLDAARLAALPGVVSHAARGAGWSLGTRDVNRTISGLVHWLASEANEMLDLQIHRPSLEDVFLELTGKPWSEATADDSHVP